MKLRNLGSSDLRISAIGVGCMNFGSMCDQAATDAIVRTAFDLGVNFFDVADIYGGTMNRSEAMLGKALGARRSQAIVATKFGAKLGRRRWRGPRRRLGGLHREGRRGQPDRRSAPTTSTSTSIISRMPARPWRRRCGPWTTSSGRARSATSAAPTTRARMLTAALETSRRLGLTPFVAAQNRYSLLTRDIEQDLVPVCLAHGVGVLPYFPLESGLLSGKYRKGEPLPEGSRFAKWRGGGSFASDARYAIVERLADYGEARGRSVLDLAIGWLAAQPAVTSVIAGVTRPEQLAQNVAAGSWDPSAGAAGGHPGHRDRA